MIIEITTLCTNLMQCFIYIFLWNHLMEQRFRHTFALGALLIVGSNALIMIGYYAGIVSYYLQSALKISCVVASVLLLYKDKTVKKLIIFIITEIVSVICTLPFEFLLSAMYHIPVPELQLNKCETVGGTILINDVLLFISIIICLVLKNRKKWISSESKQILTMLCFVVIHFVFSLIQFSERSLFQKELNCLVHSAFQIMLFVLVYVQYSTTLRNWELTKQAQELEHIRLQQDYIYNYYLLAEQRFQDVAVLRQDMQNLMHTVQELNANGCTGQVESLLHDESITEQRFCSIPVIDAVLRLKSQESAQQGIRTEFTVQDLPESLLFTDSDLCSVFANLLDNAIHSCKNDSNLQEHFIILTGCMQENFFVLTIVNSYGWAEFPHHTKQTDDTSIIGHGHGTKIVESIANKYKGSFTIRHEAKTIIAELRLPAAQTEGNISHV